MILILCLLQLIFIAMVWELRSALFKRWKTIHEYTKESLLQLIKDVSPINNRFDRVDHDLQQVKTRLHWSRERELKKPLTKKTKELK